MVAIGLVSYSAYLWHWPILAFYRYGHPTLSPLASGVMFALTMILAWLTYIFVEQTVRRRNEAAGQTIAKW